MKQPNPERLVVTEGIPITVHSAEGRGGEGRGGEEKEREEREGRRGGERRRNLVMPKCVVYMILWYACKFVFKNMVWYVCVQACN